MARGAESGGATHHIAGDGGCGGCGGCDDADHARKRRAAQGAAPVAGPQGGGAGGACPPVSAVAQHRVRATLQAHHARPVPVPLPAAAISPWAVGG